MRNVAIINYFKRLEIETELFVLIEIEKECLFDYDMIKKEMQNFFEDSPKLNEIIQFVAVVYYLGYYIADFTTFVCTEIKNLPKEKEELQKATISSRYKEQMALYHEYVEYKTNGKQKIKK